MTQDQFHSWLQEPQSMDAESIPQLREVIKRYPYFQTAQIMLAKNLKDVNHIDQLNQLQLAAIMAPDRKRFHAYLHDKLTVSEPSELVVEQEPKEEPIALKTDLEQSFADDLIPEPIIYQLETAELPELPVEEAPEEELRKEEPEALSFSEWLQFASDNELPSETTKQEPKLTGPPKETRSNIELIDHFLDQHAESPKKRAEFFNPQKVAAKSQTEDFTVVSETLAKIYFQQEKYDLATQAYEALRLKYPEKSVYFAARLKEIADKQNSEN